MFYRENGQFKTSYAADQQILAIRRTAWASSAILVLAFVARADAGHEYMFRAILLPFLILSMAAIGLNILVGYCGQITLGTGAFMAVGAYAAYNFMVRIDGMPLLASLLLGGCAARSGHRVRHSQPARARPVPRGGDAGGAVLLPTGPSCASNGSPTIPRPARCRSAA
jgi:hypothetical protein